MTIQQQMLFTETDIIRRRMNECGAEGRPFLFVVDYEMAEGYFVERPMEQAELLFELNGVGNKPATSHSSVPDTLKVSPIPPEEYKKMFDVVREGLERDKTMLTNLTVCTLIETIHSLEDIFASANTKYQLLVPGRFVCFSPECFVCIADGRIATFPMKGTIDASVPDAEEVILTDPKEAAEHAAAVELLADDLRLGGAENVRVEQFRYIDRLKTSEREILQVSSEIVGDLPDDWPARLGDIIFAMLPGGSIAGAPKASTLDVIRRAEPVPRGFYCGVFGYFDGTTLDSGVLIRFIEQDGEGQKFFRSGGGVTIDSDWRKEYDEVLAKIYLPR